MKYIPKIIFKLDIDQEAQMFHSFLHHKYFVGHRAKILRSFPELEKELGRTNAEGKAIRDFLKIIMKLTRAKSRKS